nr:MAG TPA: hypothetical protein [Caudoviricetes sp.]
MDLFNLLINKPSFLSCNYNNYYITQMFLTVEIHV